MSTTKIEWATKVWNPVTGCDKISEGCERCYAKPFAENRLRNNPNIDIKYKYRDGFKPTFHPESLKEPYYWKKPQRIFVCSMGDLFHDDITDQEIIRVLMVVHENPQHTFMLLTKRAERMKEFFTNCLINPFSEPLKNLWLGVTAENQQRADERIPILLKIPAAVRFVSIEPMLGPVDISMYMVTGWTEPPYDDIIHWVICGGETGHQARTMERDWAASLYFQCKKYETPFFFKQWGGKDKSVTIAGEEIKQFPSNK